MNEYIKMVLDIFRFVDYDDEDDDDNDDDFVCTCYLTGKITIDSSCSNFYSDGEIKTRKSMWFSREKKIR